MSAVPEFSKNAVTVTVSPGSGALGLNSMPRWSSSGLTSAIANETTVSPRTMSRVASPSISARAGADQVLWLSSRSPPQTVDDEPSSPSKAHRERPYATSSSCLPSPSMSIHVGGATAISSLGRPLLCSRAFCQAWSGLEPPTSWQPAWPCLSVVSWDQVTQQTLSCSPSPSVSITTGGASA